MNEAAASPTLSNWCRRRELDPEGLFVLRGRGGLVGAVLCLALPGAAGLVWPPQCVPGGRRARRRRRAPAPRRRLAARPGRQGRPGPPLSRRGALRRGPAAQRVPARHAAPVPAPRPDRGPPAADAARRRPGLPALRPGRPGRVPPDAPANLRKHSGLSRTQRGRAAWRTSSPATAARAGSTPACGPWPWRTASRSACCC